MWFYFFYKIKEKDFLITINVMEETFSDHFLLSWCLSIGPRYTQKQTHTDITSRKQTNQREREKEYQPPACSGCPSFPPVIKIIL